MSIFNWFTSTLELIASITLYPNGVSWNILNVFFFMVMVAFGFFQLKDRFGIIKASLIAVMLAFTLTSVQDELTQILRFNIINSTRFLEPVDMFRYWIHRLSWRLFISYFVFKYAMEYEILGKSNMLSFTTTSRIWTVVFTIYVYLVYVVLFNYNGFRTWQNTGYPLWFVYSFGDIAVWQLRILTYTTMWRKRK